MFFRTGVETSKYVCNFPARGRGGGVCGDPAWPGGKDLVTSVEVRDHLSTSYCLWAWVCGMCVCLGVWCVCVWWVCVFLCVWWVCVCVRGEGCVYFPLCAATFFVSRM